MLILRRLRATVTFVFVLLVIEFLDELVFGVQESALPLIQADLGLSYTQIGLLYTIPTIVSSFIEPVMGIYADMGKRRALILGGGVAFGIALLGIATSQSYLMFLAAMVLFFPASGAFVSLSQSALMDTDPSRHEQNMARWTFAGSLGVVGGSSLVVVITSAGVDWRVLYVLMGALAFGLVVVASRFRFAPVQPDESDDDENDDATDTEITSFRDGLRGAFQALRQREILRWLTLLTFSDLMLDGLLAYLALYFVNLVGVSPAQAAIGVTVWNIVGLMGDFLMIPLLERVRGLDYLRVSAALKLVLYPAFLLVEPFAAKVAILAVLGLLNAGWYAILQGQLYAAMPGRSGTVLAVDNIFGLVGSLIPLTIGIIADQISLALAMWLLILGPIALLVGIPRKDRRSPHV